MIEKLTTAQEKKVPVYLNKWLKNGRSTKRLKKRQTIEAIKTIYSCAGMEEPKHFFIFPSPLQCQLAVSILKNTEMKEALNEKTNLESNLWSNLWSNLGSNLRSNLESNLWSNLWSNLGSNLGSNLWSNLGSNLRSNLESNLWSNLRSNLGSNLGSNLWSNLWSNLESNLWSNLRSNLESNLWSNLWSNLEDMKFSYEYMFYGNHWVGWVGFYDFILNELFEERVKEFSKFIEYMKALESVHVFIPYKDVVFISDNPIEININAEGRLHNENSPSMLYSDGYALFYLNGIKTPKYFIETPKEKITKGMYLKEENADVRREVTRKIGLHKTVKMLGAKTVDTYKTKTGGTYELLHIDFDGRSNRPYLKMKCSSSKEVFILGSHPETKTAKQAVEYLNNGHKREGVNVVWEA